MNVNLVGARSQARLEWNRLDESRRAAAALRNRILLAVVIAVAAYVILTEAFG